MTCQNDRALFCLCHLFRRELYFFWFSIWLLCTPTVLEGDSREVGNAVSWHFNRHLEVNTCSCCVQGCIWGGQDQHTAHSYLPNFFGSKWSLLDWAASCKESQLHMAHYQGAPRMCLMLPENGPRSSTPKGTVISRFSWVGGVCCCLWRCIGD